MIRLAVQEKSLVRVNRIKSQAQWLLDRIHNAVRGPQFDHRLVKIRVKPAIPQMRLRHRDAQGIRRRHIGRERDFCLATGHGISLCIQHRRDQRLRLVPPRPVGNLRGHVNHRLLLGDLRLQPRDAGRAVVGGGEIFRRRYNQMHRPVKSAINRKIAAQRRDVRLPLVAHAHGE